MLLFWYFDDVGHWKIDFGVETELWDLYVYVPAHRKATDAFDRCRQVGVAL